MKFSDVQSKPAAKDKTELDYLKEIADKLKAPQEAQPVKQVKKWKFVLTKDREGRTKEITATAVE